MTYYSLVVDIDVHANVEAYVGAFVGAHKNNINIRILLYIMDQYSMVYMNI